MYYEVDNTDILYELIEKRQTEMIFWNKKYLTPEMKISISNANTRTMVVLQSKQRFRKV